MGVLTHIVRGPAVWRGEEMATSSVWLENLSSLDADDLLRNEMSARPEGAAILAARNGLRESYAETEA